MEVINYALRSLHPWEKNLGSHWIGRDWVDGWWNCVVFSDANLLEYWFTSGTRVRLWCSYNGRPRYSGWGVLARREVHTPYKRATLLGTLSTYRIPNKKHCWRWSDEREMQRTYQVTMSRVRANIVAVERQLVLHIVCVCSLRHLAWNVRAPYCYVACPTLVFLHVS
jgi:hypothetical protein